MTGISKAHAAALAGVGVRRLDQLAHEDDPPPRSSDGTYPPKEFGDWLRRRQLASLGVAQDGTVYDYDAERARLTHHQANIASLDEAKRRGELIPAEDVAREWADMVGRCRSKLLALPAIAWLLGRAMGLTEVAFQMAVLFAALPTASSAYILAMRMGGDGPGVARLISATTVVAAVTLTGWLALLRGA